MQLTNGKDELMLVTRQGMSIRFDEEQLRDQGRDTVGVWGIELEDGGNDAVVSVEVVAPNATLAGDVVLAAGSSVWYGAVVRGDTGAIRIGKNSNIQDNAVLHTGPNLGVTIGKNVSIGHSAVVHGCTVGDGALIGMHATVMNGAVVGKNAVVAAGALVLENTVVPDGMVAMGVPAKVREAASPALVEANRKNAEGYVAEATAHAEANK